MEIYLYNCCYIFIKTTLATLFIEGCLKTYNLKKRIMAKQIPQNPLPLSFEDRWLDNPSLQWIYQNGKTIGYVVLATLLILLLAYRYLATTSAQDEKDFAKAPQALALLNDPEKRDAALNELKLLLTKHPEIQPTYDGPIAQTLLNQGLTEEAEPFIQRTLARVAHETPADDLIFASTSLLISQGNLKEALTQAYDLKNKMLTEAKENKTADFGGTLYAFNLIRIALIEKELKHAAEEQKAWGELQELTKGNYPIKIAPFEIHRIMTHFDDEGAKLKDFVN